MATNYAACPKCGTADPKTLNFTWWGGALGPKLLTHVKCLNCCYKYNGKSGKDNTVGIAIYFAVVGAVSFVLMFIAFVFLFKF